MWYTAGMVVDFHTHIFPASICAARKSCCRMEPAFELLYSEPASRMVGQEELLAAMDADGVDRAVVFGFPWRQPDLFRRHNDFVMEAVRAHPARFVGFGCIDPLAPGAAEEAERCLDGGLSGIGELAFYGSGIDDACLAALAPIMEVCRRRNRPVLLHTNEPVGHAYAGKTPNTLAQLYRLVERFEDNTLVLAHWGGGLFFYHLLKKEVKDRLRNVYFDTAASPFLYDPSIYAIAGQVIGFDRILFGSDYPLIPPGRYFKELEFAAIDPDARRQICGENARRLLGL
jgi:predicted TIM-barrel fold metal-dependent hydrolase